MTLVKTFTLSVREFNSSKDFTNITSPPPSALGMSCFTMIFGAISNISALGILAESRATFRRKSKLYFLFLTVALLLADLCGHVILGSFALHVHINQMYDINILDSNPLFCNVFGASMVFFGLSPLLLGCAMAVERCVAIARPFFHFSMITKTRVPRVVIILITLALLQALLPLSTVGNYTVQSSRTWCFLNIHNSNSTADKGLALMFSGLGLTALVFSLFCNILSGLALLQARIKSIHGDRIPPTFRRVSSVSSSSLFCSLDVEMMVQLAAITVVSCVCWGPFLMHIFITQLSPRDSDDRFTLPCLRMAAWNQILDPWVYILLRRTVFSKIWGGLHARGTVTANGIFAESHRHTFTLN